MPEICIKTFYLFWNCYNFVFVLFEEGEGKGVLGLARGVWELCNWTHRRWILKSDSKQDVPVLCLTSTLVFNEPPLKTPKSFFDAENVVTFVPLSQKNVCKVVRK